METLERWIEIGKIGIYVAEWIAAITGLLYWRYLRNTYWRWFPLYLLFIAVIEITNHFLGARYAWLPEYFFPLAVIPAEFIFFGWLLFRQESTHKYSWLFLTFLGIYLLSVLAEQLFLKSGDTWFVSQFSYSIGNILLLVLLLRYIAGFLRSKAVLHYRKNPMFWIWNGLFIFYLGSFPFFGLGNMLHADNPDVAYKMYIGVCILCIIMYLLFAISFLWTKHSK